MTVSFRRAALVCLCLLVAACSVTPRGAGFRNEVLAADGAKDAAGNPVYDFAVFSVTRASLPLLSGWPVQGKTSYPWLPRVDQPASMIITPGDTLSISIWDADDNSLLTAPGQRVTNLQEIRVGSDGRIFLPFVGDLKVSGMAPDTARARIQERLLDTVPSAQVQLNVAPGRANTVTLASGVRTPGVIPLADRNVSLLSLIGSGGGVMDSINNPQVRLFRGDKAYAIALERLFEDPRLDTVVQGGDRIIIAEDDRYFLSLGAAAKEALHEFPKAEVSALDAMSIIGGVVSTRANPQGILILREYPASAVEPLTVAGALPSPAGPPQDRVVFTLDLTTADGLFSAGKFKIQTGDLVYITETPLGTATTVLNVFSSVLTARARL